MRLSLVRAGALLLASCFLASCNPRADGGDDPSRGGAGFPMPDRPPADSSSPGWTGGVDRDATDESGQLIRGLGIRAGMSVADIGAGSGYHTLRLAPTVGPSGRVYAQDIVESYLSGLRREAASRGLKNVHIVVGKPDDPGLPPNSVDRAVLVHMYHEIRNPYALVYHLAPALKPGAQVGVIDVDKPTANYGTPPALLKCEFEAVGYRQVGFVVLRGGGGYLAIFEPPKLSDRPKPRDIKACRA